MSDERTIRLVTIWGLWTRERSLELFSVIDENQENEAPAWVDEAIEKAQNTIGTHGPVKRIDVEVPVSATQVKITDLNHLPLADVFVLAANDNDAWWTIDGVDRETIDLNDEALSTAFVDAQKRVGRELVSVFPVKLNLDKVHEAFKTPIFTGAGF